MRKLVSAMAVFAVAVAFGSPVQAQTGITNSAHDFSNSTTWNSTPSSTAEICVFCHAPHNNKAGYSPLWNHAISGGQAYSMYTFFSTTAAAVKDPAPTGSSAMCLSCHDGQLAVDNYGTNAGGGAATTLNSGDSQFFGTDLTNDHPISFVYDPLDAGLNATSTGVTGAASGISTVADLLDANSKVQCSSCHDVHNQGPAGVGKLLVKSNQSSQLCLACHIK